MSAGFHVSGVQISFRRFLLLGVCIENRTFTTDGPTNTCAVTLQWHICHFEVPSVSFQRHKDELETLLSKDSYKTQYELAKALGVTQATISRRLKALGFIQKVGNWVPHELKPRDVEMRFCMSEMHLERYKRKSFLHRIITGDAKWIHYDNLKGKKLYVKPGQPETSMSKPNIHGSKVMLSIWWDQEGPIHYELLKSGQIITGQLYRQQ